MQPSKQVVAAIWNRRLKRRRTDMFDYSTKAKWNLTGHQIL